MEDDGSRLFLEHLVRTGRLTAWQAGKLNDGRHKGFFLGSYRLLSRLGAGGMSTVYLAEHIHMRQRRALKVLPRHRVGDSSYLERFYREARAAAALDHANVVHAYDVGCDGDIHFLVMEFVEGSDLQKFVARRGVLSYDSAAEVIRQTALGLTHAHKSGVIHRDIKPANLLIDNSGTVKILDMGLARYTAEESEKQASLTQMHDENVIGTTNYLAPEQALNSHKADARSDIYSLGCTMYYALTGLPPFNTGTVAERLMAHIHQKPESVTKHRPNAPRSLVEICERMLEKKPDDRYQSAEEIVGVLKAWRKQWGVEEGGKSSSGIQIGVPYVAEEEDELEPGGVGSMRDTDAVRAQATSIGKRGVDDDE
ncbi:MAG: serine/threonine-protein kinase, partial [Pirellulales bacterium]